jgi:hypothetical protein
LDDGSDQSVSRGKSRSGKHGKKITFSFRNLFPLPLVFVLVDAGDKEESNSAEEVEYAAEEEKAKSVEVEEDAAEEVEPNSVKARKDAAQVEERSGK